MTMQAPKPSVGLAWGKLDQTGKERVLKEVAKESAVRFAAKIEAYKEATGLRKPPPAQRLEMYRARPGPLWELLRQALPKRYEEQMKDWEALEEAEASDAAGGS